MTCDSRTPVVESDFSVVNCDKSANRQSLSDISLDSILHAKQFELGSELGSGSPGRSITRILR
jgi:hypothetical protein